MNFDIIFFTGSALIASFVIAMFLWWSNGK